MLLLGVIFYSDGDKRFYSSPTGCYVYSFKHKEYNEFVQMIKEYAYNNGYHNEDVLNTENAEECIVFYKDKPEYLEYPKEKLCIYHHSVYEGEHGAVINGDFIDAYRHPSLIDEKYKPFFNMFCGNWGRNYRRPRKWVDIENYLFIVVDEWNEGLNWVMNKGGNLPFTLVAAIVKSNKDEVFVVTDIRKNKKDYDEKCKVLFDILDIQDRKMIRKQSYFEMKKMLMQKEK